MESLPLIAKSNIIPNLDVTSLIREIFQTELESYVPSKKLSENLRKSLEYGRFRDERDGQETYRSVSYLENLANDKRKLIEYAEDVLEAYGKHEEALNKIMKVELNIMETQAMYLKREKLIREDDFLQNELLLKRHPLMKSYNADYVKEYKLLQGESGLPPKHEANLDFRIKDFKEWKKRLSSPNNESSVMKYVNKTRLAELPPIGIPKPDRKERVTRPKRTMVREEKPVLEVFRADTTAICFTGYTVGDVYECRVTVRNVHTKPMKFNLKPLPMTSPFKVNIYGTKSTRILPGLAFKLLVTFEPRSSDDEDESIVLSIEDGTEMMIPITSYLEPPVLKTHEDLDEQTKKVPDKIRSSYIDCGPCFPGDSKVTKIRFYSFGGTGEFFLMSQENWNNWHIENLTPDNFTEIPPFRFYPTYFKMDENQVIDLYVEFKPSTSGLHSDNIIIACNNGEIRNLDILGDGIAYNRSFFTFEESLEKNFSPAINDDFRATFYLDMGCSLSTGKNTKAFFVTNNSVMAFEFRWEMRDVVITFGGQSEPKKLTPYEVKIEPSSGVFEPRTTRTFLASVSAEMKSIGEYRAVLSFYVIGLPYDSIEQANTIIRPSVLRGRFKSGSVFGEEDNLLVSPEFSYQGTLESVQEGMRTSMEIKCQQQCPMSVCRKHPSICAVPLKRSKTFSNIGDGADGCTCSALPTSEAAEPAKGYDFNQTYRKPDITDLGSDLMWDFVDVLVDEVEIWFEVVPADVRIEPCIINLYSDVRVYEEPVQYEVYVHNYGDLPVTCKWVKFKGRSKLRFDESEEELSTLYHVKDQEKQDESEVKGEHVEWDPLSESSDSSAEDYQVKCYISQRCCVDSDTVQDASANRHCDIRINPKGPFTVLPQTRMECIVYVSANQPGFFNRVLYLIIDDADEQPVLHIIGRVPDYEITVTPNVLDFGTCRSGARFTKFFKIKSLSGERVEWKVEQFSFDYQKGELIGPIDEKMQSSLTRVRGVVEEEGCTIEKYKLDARKTGMQTSLLKFDLLHPSYAKCESAYLVVLAKVQTPELAIEASRFQNAILAPSRTMYVGQVITQNIVLRNVTNVATTFVWGHPFGCHARKLKIKMSPKNRAIGSRKKVYVEVQITPLEEGIVEHFYIPCFFSRKVSPVILSIVGVIKTIQVTFSIGWNNQQCRRLDDVLKISWPIKNFDPLIGMDHIPESKILDFECHCDAVEEEYVKAKNAEVEEGEEVKPVAEESRESKPCVMKYYTPTRMMELKKAILQKEPYEETGDLTEVVRKEEVKEEGKKSESVSTVAEYSKRECVDFLYYAASELQFLNVLYKTVAVKSFVIKNDSPLKANFSLRVKYFGKAEQQGCKDKIREIKKRVLGRQKDRFEDSLIYCQPLLIMTSPSEGTLDGFSSVRVSVFAYGNTWGEYRDFIICNISGTPPFFMKVFVQLSGHPILFPMFNASFLDVPVLRFNEVRYKADPIVRTIKVRNTSSIPITVTWMVFLTSPLPEDSKDEPFNLCLDLYTDKESEDQEKKSSQNYLSKNTSGSVPFLDMTDVEKTSSQCTGMEPLSEDDSGKRTSPVVVRCCESGTTPTIFDLTKPEIQLLENFGKIDLKVFQVSPRELDLEPYSEAKIVVTFDPNIHEQNTRKQLFEAVATGCIRLRQEYSHYPGIYDRLCGKDYVSKLLVMSASVERPLLQFEFFTSDLQYIINANDVLKSKKQECKLVKKYIVRNRNETSVTAFVTSQPGDVFAVKRIESSQKVYAKFKPEHHPITVEAGDSVQVHVEATVTYNHVLEMRKKLKYSTKKNMEIRSEDSELVAEGLIVDETTEEDSQEKDYYCIGSPPKSYNSYTDSNFKITPVDSFSMIQRRATEWRSLTDGDGKIVCTTKVQPLGEDDIQGETAECFVLGLPTPAEPKQQDWCHVLKENIIFEQVGLAKQVITPELRVFFPSIKLSSELIDFGNVHIGETSRRYSSVLNLTQFPTEFSVASPEETEFFVTPKVGYLPATNYKSDNGSELTVMFSPKEPGYFKTTFKVFGNREMVFGYVVLTVLGFGTWNEKYKYPKVDVPATIIISPRI